MNQQGAFPVRKANWCAMVAKAWPTSAGNLCEKRQKGEAVPPGGERSKEGSDYIFLCLKGSYRGDRARLSSGLKNKGKVGNKQELQIRMNTKSVCSPGTGPSSGCLWTRP